jgi:hypothetical protein
MATTGELLTIVEELELVDIGDAASYLGEEPGEMEETLHENVSLSLLVHKILTDREYAFR